MKLLESPLLLHYAYLSPNISIQFVEASSERGPPAGRSHQASRFASRWELAGLQSSLECTGASPRGETAIHSTGPMETRESVFSTRKRSQLKLFSKRGQENKLIQGLWLQALSVFHTEVFSLKSRNKKSYQHKAPMQDRWAQTGLQPPREGKKTLQRQNRRKQAASEESTAEPQRRQQVPSASCEEPHLTHQQFPHSQNKQHSGHASDKSHPSERAEGSWLAFLFKLMSSSSQQNFCLPLYGGTCLPSESTSTKI